MDVTGVDRYVAAGLVHTHSHVVHRPWRGATGAHPVVVIHRPMTWTLKRVWAIWRADPRDGAAEMRALGIERHQSVRVVDQEELSLDISQRGRVDRRDILGGHRYLLTESACLVRPEEQPGRRPHQRQHRSHRTESGIAQELAAIRAHREAALAVATKKGEKRRGNPPYDQAEQRSQNHEHARVLCQASLLPAIRITCPCPCT